MNTGEVGSQADFCSPLPHSGRNGVSYSQVKLGAGITACNDVLDMFDGGYVVCGLTGSGEWYFTGKYPTPGGIRLCNAALVSYIEKNVSLLSVCKDTI